MTSSPSRSEIWFSDGSVVLQVENIQFRVYWGVLTQQSSFFRTMQNLPQPPNQPSIDGCPVIELQDAVGDVEYLLRALYIPTFLAQDALPLPAVAALIRLGRKYDFSDLLNLAVQRLSYENPKTLAEYDALITAHGGNAYKLTRIIYHPGVLMDMVTIARENGLLSVLPCAYYRVLLHHSPAQIFDGVLRRDGTVASLAFVDQRRCIVSRDELIKARFQEGCTLGWLKKWDYDHDCQSPQMCAEGRHARTHYYMNCSPLWILQRSVQDKKSLCSACFRHATESVVEGRKKMWEDLPKWFDLPPWAELRDQL
ncbi:BTB domain-containing protein [Favolaschia claudopus]|uniref:BTB domain-containing protein n=1 Tax=Favolaschia claudopus TaxID=2862362 RepID=A0AAW0E1Z2_9AGAR